ncbi:hypothetical protein Tco_0826560 [Tanacetum coccineum]
MTIFQIHRSDYLPGLEEQSRYATITYQCTICSEPPEGSPTTESPDTFLIPILRRTVEDDEEDPDRICDYPADRGDDRDHEEPFDDDDDDDDAEEEEHLAPANPAAVAYSADQRPIPCYRRHGSRNLKDKATPSGEQFSPPVSKAAKQLAARRNQERIKSILLLAIPDEYLLKFHNVPDAKSLWAAIKSRFGGNEESKKMQKNVLKHQFENFVYASNETLDKAYDRIQNLISQLEIHKAYEDEIIYSQLDDARYDRALLRARVNRLDSDRPFHRRTALLIEEEARLSRAAWARSMNACDQAVDRRRQSVITELLKADYRRQRQLVETLKIVKSLKAQMIELQTQQGPAKDPAEPELPEEAGSNS